MEIRKTSEYSDQPAVNLLLYGSPKVGKSTFATTASGVLVADAESGYRYFGSKGIDIPVAEIKVWEDMQEFYKEASKPEYKTIVIDPVNEVLDKLLRKAKTNKLYTQTSDPNALSMKGWGFVKDKMREMLKTFRDLNKSVIFVAHEKSLENDGEVKKIPRLDANLAGDLMAMMDLIGYMSILTQKGETKRFIAFQPSARFEAGDRTGSLPEYFNPDDGFEKIKEILSGNWKFNMEKKIQKNMSDFEKSLMVESPSVEDYEVRSEDLPE